jgi:hypothetical protein
MENGSRTIGLRVAAGFLVAITIIVAVFAAGITLPSQEVRTGRLTVLLTDAPVDLEKLMITITDLEVHQVDEEDGEWITLIEDDKITFDLLEYQEGKTLNLASVEIAAAKYNKIRLYIFEAEAYYAEDSETGIPLNVPPDKIDVITKFELEPEGSKVVTIDMEPDWVHIKNNNLRPVLKATISEEPAPTPTQQTTTGGS